MQQTASKDFLDVLYDKIKLPWSFAKKLIYKVGLLVYYLINFIYIQWLPLVCKQIILDII